MLRPPGADIQPVAMVRCARNHWQCCLSGTIEPPTRGATRSGLHQRPQQRRNAYGMTSHGSAGKVAPQLRLPQCAGGGFGTNAFAGSALPLPNRLPLPRRYEETKPVQMQNITHRSILGIGQSVNASVAEKYELEKEAALKEVEKAVWAEAEILKAVAVNIALEKLSEDHKKELRDRAKTYERELKEESLRASLTLQRQAREQLAEQQEAARRSLQEALAALHQRADAERLRAVDEVRLEEQQRSADAVLKIKQTAAKVLSSEVERLAGGKVKAVDELNKAHEAIVKAAQQRHSAAVEALQKQLVELQSELEAQERELSAEIRRRERIQAELQERIAAELLKEAAVVRELHATQIDWESFLRRSGAASDLAADDAVAVSLTEGASEISAYQIRADR